MSDRMKYMLMGTVVILMLLLSLLGPGFLSKSMESIVLNKTEVLEDTYYLQRFQYNLPEGERLNLLVASLLGSGFSGSTHYRTVRGLSEDSPQSRYIFTPSFMERSSEELTENMAVKACADTLSYYSSLGLLPPFDFVYNTDLYDAALYLAVDIQDPERNLLLWQIRYSSKNPLIHGKNILMEAYVDAQSGALYLFSLRAEEEMDGFSPDALVKEWSARLGLGEYLKVENDRIIDSNLIFSQYSFFDTRTGDCDIYIGYYSGIKEYFISFYID